MRSETEFHNLHISHAYLYLRNSLKLTLNISQMFFFWGGGLCKLKAFKIRTSFNQRKLFPCTEDLNSKRVCSLTLAREWPVNIPIAECNDSASEEFRVFFSIF